MRHGRLISGNAVMQWDIRVSVSVQRTVLQRETSAIIYSSSHQLAALHCLLHQLLRPAWITAGSVAVSHCHSVTVRGVIIEGCRSMSSSASSPQSASPSDGQCDRHCHSVMVRRTSRVTSRVDADGYDSQGRLVGDTSDGEAEQDG